MSEANIITSGPRKGRRPIIDYEHGIPERPERTRISMESFVVGAAVAGRINRNDPLFEVAQDIDPRFRIAYRGIIAWARERKGRGEPCYLEAKHAVIALMRAEMKARRPKRLRCQTYKTLPHPT